MFKKILVAYDFSELSEAAAQFALWLARKSGGSVSLANVLTDFRAAMEAMPADLCQELVAGDIDKFHKDLCSGAELRLINFIKTLPAEGVEVEHEILLGNPYVAITHAVQKNACDIVISGTRDISKIKKFLTGSTSKNLVRHCPSAVWVLRSQDQVALTSIVVAVDLSEVSAKALKLADWLARQSGAELHVLHVVDSKDFPLDMFKDISSVGELSRDWKAEIEKSGLKGFEDFVSKTGVSAGTRRMVWGEPCLEINSEVERTGAQLVVMGTVGRRGLSGLLMGNTAEKVLDSCKASILSVKPDSFISSIDSPL